MSHQRSQPNPLFREKDIRRKKRRLSDRWLPESRSLSWHFFVLRIERQRFKTFYGQYTINGYLYLEQTKISTELCQMVVRSGDFSTRAAYVVSSTWWVWACLKDRCVTSREMKPLAVQVTVDDRNGGMTVTRYRLFFLLVEKLPMNCHQDWRQSWCSTATCKSGNLRGSLKNTQNTYILDVGFLIL